MAANSQAEPGAAVAPTGAEILAAITACKETLTTKIDFLTIDVGLIHQDMDKFRSRIAEVEDRVSTVEDTVRADSREVRALQLQVKALQERAIDTENHLRRNNIRILGLPERAEGPRPAEFTEQLLSTLFSLGDMPPTFVVERAHRVPLLPPRPGAPPHPFLLRLLNYRDRDRILAAARAMPEIKYENTKLLFFPDFSQEVQQRHKSFTDVRRRLRERGKRFGLLYPSRLRITDGDNTRFFDTPEAAAAWLDTR